MTGQRVRKRNAAVSFVTLLLTPATLFAAEAARDRGVAGDDLFSPPRVVRLQIDLSETNAEALREQPRRAVEARVQETGGAGHRVGLHLKGRTGSFRPLDGKPAMTLDFARFDSAARFHGLAKIHLNNSVEDPTYLCEYLGSTCFADAGYPATRAAWALVELNGKPLGLYVLKEGFTAEFLERHFKSSAGNLYEATPANDVEGRLARDSGTGPDTQEDLRALAAAALTADPAERWQALASVLDVDRFLTFIALEVILGHRDGYCLARNNFRLYHDPTRNRFVFLPHGMDVLFGRTNATWRPVMSGLVAKAALETPEGKQRYRPRLEATLDRALNLTQATNRIDAALRAFRAALPAQEYKPLASAAAGLQARVPQRKADLLRQLRQPEVPLLSFAQGSVTLTNGWRARDLTASVTLDRGAAPDGRSALHLKAGPRSAASWRCRVRVPAGDYRWAARIMTRGVVALPFGRNQGAAVRANAPAGGTSPGLTGDARWQSLAVDFSVTAPELEVELVCELRASAGEAWFDASSLRLTRRGGGGTGLPELRPPAVP